jgi:hypothetical protein
LPTKSPKRQRHVTYRAERFDVHFNVKLPRALREAVRAGAAAEGVRDSHFGRHMLTLGLTAWRARTGKEGFPSGLRMAPGPRSVGRGLLFDLMISAEMRTALGVGAVAGGVTLSEFARWMLQLGLEAWWVRRTAKMRNGGGC